MGMERNFQDGLWSAAKERKPSLTFGMEFITTGCPRRGSAAPGDRNWKESQGRWSVSPDKNIDEKLFDVRAVDRNMKKKYIDKAQYKKHLDAIPDAASKAVPLELDQDQEILEREEWRRQSEEQNAGRQEKPRKGPVASDEEREEED